MIYYYWIIALCLHILLCFKSAKCVECFCTEENNCEVLGKCEGSTCLVGVLKTNQILRTCGSQPIGCYRNVGRWLEVCSCTEHRCNSFYYYRENITERFRILLLILVSFFFRNSTLDTNSDSNDQSTTQTSLLTILIVAVPLAVGAAMVVVVAFNYYCHLC
uniref:Activin_recp domain-containing protein n=1 Tax=Syphacia muris TaxID=451379 RepID=A0A0N5ASH9_9BILA